MQGILNNPQKNNPFLAIYLVLCIFLWILSGWNTHNYDYENYVIGYAQEWDTFTNVGNPGFAFLNNIFYKLGFSFELFHIVIYGVFIFFITHVVWGNSKMPILILFIYFFTAYFGDIIQLKNTVAIIFLYIGIFTLINVQDQYATQKFVICNLIATSIHIGFVFYFVFVLYKRRINPVYFIIFCIVSSIFGHKILEKFSTYSFVTDNAFLMQRSEYYLESSSFWSVIICSFQYLIHYVVCKRFIKNRMYDKKYQFFFNITVLLSVVLILCSINMTFFRLFRNMLLISSIFILNGYVFNKKKNDIVWLTFYFIFMSVMHFWITDVFPNMDLVFMNNSLW